MGSILCLTLSMMIVLLQFGSSRSEELSIVLSHSRLPMPRSNTAAQYDGDDAVYIFGGSMVVPPFVSDEIMKYTISADTLDVVGHLPVGVTGGVTSICSGGFIYLIDGGSQEIYKYSPEDGTVALLSPIPRALIPVRAAVKSDPSADEVYLFGGHKDIGEIGLLNMKTGVITMVGNIESRYDETMTVVADDKGSAYIFGNLPERGTAPYSPSKIDLGSLGASPVGEKTFPYLHIPGKAVWDGTNVYVIGGFNNATEYGDAKTEAILKFSPESETTEVIPVTGFYGIGAVTFGRLSVVYVEKSKRIYLFGGYSRVLHSQIGYIEVGGGN